MAPIGVKLWENAFQTIPDNSFFDAQTICLAIFYFKNFGVDLFARILRFGGARIFERHRQIPRQKSLPVVRSMLLYDPWRRGKSVTDRFCS